MPKFQSLSRLLIFHAMTLVIMLALYYAMMLVLIKNIHQEQTIMAFEAFRYEILSLKAPTDDDIETILEKPMFQDLSYQLILMLPSGQTFIHRASRPDEPKFAAVAFPVVNHQYHDKNSAHTITGRTLTATLDLKNDAQVYLVIRNRPVKIDWTAYPSWMPLMVAIALFIGALLFILNRRNNWEQLLSYTDNLIASAKDGYTPPPFDKAESPIEFLRLGHLLGRISHDLHQKNRRIKTISHRLDRLVDKAPLPMLMVMREGQISFFNQRFEQVFTTSFQRGTSYKLTDFVTGSDKATQQILNRLCDQKVARTLLVFGLEDQLAYQLHLTPWFGEHGQIHGFTVLLSGVDQWLEQINTLTRACDGQLQQINEMIRLRSVLGHELRTPLNAIIGTLDLIDPDDLTHEQKDILATLVQSSQAMLALLNDMLEMAKIESGKVAIIDEPVDIFRVSQNVSTLMIGSARRKGIELIYAFMPDCPRYIHTDHTRLRQILLNLLDNSVKFTASGHVALIVDLVTPDEMIALSQEKLQEKRAQIDDMLSDNDIKAIAPPIHHWLETIANKQQSWVRFRIMDTGIGISLDEQQRLFSFFNQANSQITRQFGGSGLGLAISNSFAHLLGGFILLTSEKDHGSCFDLFLPNQAPKFQPIYHPQDKFSRIHLIGIINSPLREDYLQRLALHLSFTAQIYHSMDERVASEITKGLSQLTNSQIPVLLIDYEYYSAAQNSTIQPLLNQLIHTPNLAKILMSMKPERGISSALLEQFDGFLNKPLDVALLLSELIRLTQESADSHGKNAYGNNEDHPPLVSNEVVGDIGLQRGANQPLQIKDNKDTQNPAKEHQPLILVVEDNPINQKITKKMLEKLGYQSLVAEDGEKALAVLDANRDDIALILMDCRMPVMDGLQATQAIRDKGDDITIIALTANNSDEDKEACLAVGMNEFLAKPINKVQLQTILDSFLASEKTAAQE